MGTRSNRLGEAVLTSTHNLCLVKKYKKYRIFLSDNFPFLVVKFSIYLNRRVFVMRCMNVEQRPGWCFAHAQNDMSLCILSMFEGTFSHDALAVLCPMIVALPWYRHIY